MAADFSPPCGRTPAGPVLLLAFKFLYYGCSMALQAATAGKVLAGSALLAVARK